MVSAQISPNPETCKYNKGYYIDNDSNVVEGFLRYEDYDYIYFKDSLEIKNSKAKILYPKDVKLVHINGCTIIKGGNFSLRIRSSLPKVNVKEAFIEIAEEGSINLYRCRVLSMSAQFGEFNDYLLVRWTDSDDFIPLPFRHSKMRKKLIEIFDDGELAMEMINKRIKNKDAPGIIRKYNELHAD